MQTPGSSYLMAVDGGTESLRVGLFDFNGTMVSKASVSYKTAYPQSGWAEQNPEDWWRALVEATRRCIGQSPIPPDNIAGICCDATTCTLVPLGAEGQALRPAVLWMDVRASVQAKRIFQTNHKALKYSLSGCNAEWMLCKALWLYESEPVIYRNTAHFVEYLDWLNYKLTGRLVLNLNTATQRWYYNQREWGWPVDLFAAVGLDDLISKIPEDILPAGRLIGRLSVEAANALGLSPSTPVFQGGGDAFVSLLGLNVTETGKLGLIAGSSNVIAGFLEEKAHDPGIFGAFPDALIPGLWLIEAGQSAAGSMLAWFKKCFAPETDFRSLDAEAGEIPLGSGGLIALDYFQGNRNPYTDSSARGAIWGLSLHATRAHVFRGLLESIAYGARHILEVFAGLGCSYDQLYACGGATRSDLFMQIIADVCGTPIFLTEVADAAMLGGAVLTACGLAVYPDIRSASRSMVKTTREYVPDRENHEKYQFYYSLYKETYHRLADLMHTMTEHQGRSV
ncbi:MAG TPA: FGGY family carbohydrate kinase [Spirochaetia bacterium]|nr:FGGY family carbohydrate kinase [Spirochaetia bacterium]